MDKQRLTSGVPGFDEITSGGLLSGRSYLVVGSPGTGKTLFSMQWLLEGCRQGERCAYLTFAEPESEIVRNAQSMGWDISDVDIIDLSLVGESDMSIEDDYQLFPPSEVEFLPVWNTMYQILRDKQPQRIVINSITQLRYLATDEYQFRKHVLRLVHFINQHHITAFLAYEPTELDRESSVALAVDGIIRLNRDISPGLAIGLRSIQIEKLRGSGFLSGRHPFNIRSNGVVIYPHRIEETGNPQAGQHMIESGISALDEMLGGGVESGTVTLLTGPTGVGKSTLGLQFLANRAEAGHPVVLFTFEEPASYIAKRSQSIGRPLDHLQANGLLKIVRVNPVEMYPDQFLQMVRKSVEQDGCRMIMIDSLHGYQLAMQEFGTPQAHIHNLVMYLTRNEVTTLLVNEIQVIAGADISATSIGVSYLADNILLLRYIEHIGQLLKVIGCLKKRLGYFQSSLRELQITCEGVQVGDALPHLRGILTGIPTIDVRE